MKPSKGDRRSKVESSYFQEFHGKPVKVKLYDGSVIEGFLECNYSLDKYNVKLATGEGVILVPKHAILTVQLSSSKTEK